MIEYLQDANEVLRKQFKGQRLRLTNDQSRRVAVYLIVDGHPVPRGKQMKRVLVQHPRIGIFFYRLLPTVESGRTCEPGRQIACRPSSSQEPDADDPHRAIAPHLYSKQRRPQKVKRYFTEEHVAYTAH